MFYSLKYWSLILVWFYARPYSCLVLRAPICHVIRARSRGSPITVRNVCNCGYLLLNTRTLHCMRFLISLLFEKPMDTYEFFLKIIFQDSLSSNLLRTQRVIPNEQDSAILPSRVAKVQSPISPPHIINPLITKLVR